MYSIIVAQDIEGNIGLNNKLIFHYKKDMDNFKKLTTETKLKDKINAVVMGRKTYESLPSKFKPLKNRLNIIMSKNHIKINELQREITNNQYDNVIIKSSIEDVLLYVKENKNIERVYVIGGEKIYNTFLEYNIINDLYITKVNKLYVGDTQFTIDNLHNYKLIKCEDIKDINILNKNNKEEDELTINHYTYNNKEEQNYLKAIKQILSEGINKDDRTGVGTKSIFGKSFRYNVRNGMLPLFTTKRVFFRGIVEELLWFLSGSTNVKILQDKNVHIWDGNSTREFLDKRGLHHLKEGDIGACFPADTLVLTEFGYKKIQDVQLYEKLYTHQGDWRNIKNIQKSTYTGKLYKFKIKFCSELIKCTDTHPIYIKKNNDFNSKTKPEWCKAMNMKKEYFVGIRKNIQNVMPIYPGINMHNENIWFVMGYLTNFIKNVDESGLIQFPIKPCDQFYTFKQFSTLINDITQDNDNKELFTINIDVYPMLSEFKDGIPEWVQNTPANYIKIYTQGYYMANWFAKEDEKHHITVSSYENALQLQRLYMKLNLFIEISETEYRIKKKVSSMYEVSDPNYIWFPIESIETEDVNNLEIHNFEVDVDNSYTVQNIAVHNSYGHQLRHFNAPYVDCNTDYTGKGIDQIKYVLELIRTDPNSRRILFCYWNPEQLNQTSLPSCFPEGTLVLTKYGYKEIQDITIKDKVLTHQGNWKSVLNTQEKVYNGNMYKFKLMYNSNIFECTEEHPFYVRDILTNSKKQQIGLSDPYWCNASKVEKEKHMLCFPINTKSLIPEFEIEKGLNGIYNQIITKKLDNYDEWYMMGYYIGNGWLDWKEGRNRFNFCLNKKHLKTNKIITNLFNCYISKETTQIIQYECSNKIWWEILKDFGHLAHNKKIPEWIQDAPKDYIKQFIDGYMDADGCITTIRKDIVYTTVSKDLAYGLQRLYAKLGIMLSVQYQIRPSTTIIEGRTVNQRNTFSMRVIDNMKRKYMSLIDNYINFPIISIDIEDKLLNVYNFEVEDDNSYIVHNTIVHNCHLLYTFYVDINKNEISLKFDQRSCDTFHGLPFNVVSATVLLNMICYLTDYIPGEIYHTISDMHIYSSHFLECDTIVKREPRIFPKIKINPKQRDIKKIEDFTYEDFELINYYPHPSVKAPMAV